MAEENDNLKKGLYLIGIGPGDVSLLTNEAIEVARRANYRRYEAYTASWPSEQLDLLQEKIGSIEKVMRPEVEKPQELFDLAQDDSVALLVVGDPLQATTHVDLQLQAEEKGIDCHVIHGISITNLVTGAIGLSNYKFGRQTTLTYPYSGWVATSPIETIAMNMFLGQHTLALLDLDPTGLGVGNQIPMSPKSAADSIISGLQKLEEMVENYPEDDEIALMKKAAINALIERPLEDIAVVLCSDMGCKDQEITLTNIANLADLSGGRMNCLVFPGTTGDVEDKALLRWYKED